MSDAEVKNDVATEAPTAEELKAKKRAAEVNFLRYSHFYMACETMYYSVAKWLELCANITNALRRDSDMRLNSLNLDRNNWTVYFWV